MADPLAFGYMPMQQALGMNWEQSLRPASSYDAQQGFLDALLRKQKLDSMMAPGGRSMDRRFGAGSPLGMLPGEQAVPPQVGPSPEEVAQLQAALMAAAQKEGQYLPELTTRETGVPYSGPGIDASEGPLRSQPWYDEYIAAAQADPGARMPMVRGSGGTPVDRLQMAANRHNRDQEMAGRRANVENNAMLKGVARRGRMYGIAPTQDPNYVEALMGALGAANDGGMAQNAFLYGPDVAQNLHTVNTQAGMANEARREQSRQWEQDFDLRRQQAELEAALAERQWQSQQAMLQDPRYWAAQGLGIGDQMTIGSLMGGGASGSFGGLPQLPPQIMANPNMPQQQMLDIGAQAGINPNLMPNIAGAIGRKEPWQQGTGNLVSANGGKVGAIQPSFWDILSHLGDVPPGTPDVRPYY